MDTQQRKTGAQREREGAIIGIIGLVLLVAGFAGAAQGDSRIALLVIGALAAVCGLVMWGAGMARRD